MQGLFNFIKSSVIDGDISNTKNSFERFERIKATYPPEEKRTTALCINLKA
jgi:hypothetical protein